MKTALHKAETRGRAEHGWLHSRHTFSFADYYDPERMGFGALRVINDDIVAPGAGFGTHAHDNMEIVSIPLQGSLRHEDSMGNVQLIQHGEVQIMSAGILNYLKSVDPAHSTWQGDCFVFDNRVTVDHALKEGDFEVCPACRMPLTGQDRKSPMFEPNVSCPKCFHRLTPEKREGLLERARQIELAARRGERHLGSR